MALIQCPSCGNQISDMAKSCPACGQRLVQYPPQAAPPVYSPSQVPPQAPYPAAPNSNYGMPAEPSQPNSSKSKGWLIALIAGLLVITIGLVAFFALTKKKVKYHESSNGNGAAMEASASEAPSTEAIEYPVDGDDIGARMARAGQYEWQEYWIDATNSKYVNVRSYTDASVDDNIVKRFYHDDYFIGNRMPDNPNWIEVFDEDGQHVGYVRYDCARRTGRSSEDYYK